MSIGTEQKYSTVKDVAVMFNVSTWTVYKRAKVRADGTREWPASPIGRALRFSPENIAAIKASLSRAVASEQPEPAYTTAELARARKRMGLA